MDGVPGVAYGGDGVAEVTVDAAAVVKLLIGMARRCLILDTADAADSDYEDDEHEDEGYTQRSDDDVERVTWHAGERIGRTRCLPLQVWGESIKQIKHVM